MQRKDPLRGKILARCIPERRFVGLFGCMARESCRELAIFPSETAFGMHGAQNLPRIAARERTAAESCHGKALENASREDIATASQAKGASGRNPATVGRWGNAFRVHFAIVERPGNAYSQRLANRAASSCGRAYCLAIALIPHESDDLFVQAVLYTRERGATSCAWRRLIVAMAGNRTGGRKARCPVHGGVH